MTPEYDIVVVGAGNAGLCAAVSAALDGKKTLLIEQNNTPGGCATSFRRGRFEFEPSLHELCDYGSEENPGRVRKLLDKIGVRIDWISAPDCYRCISTYSDGASMDVTMPSGMDAYIDKMEEYVPGSRASMVAFFDLLKELESATDYLILHSPDKLYMMKHFPNVLRTGGYTTIEVLNALGIPQRAIDIISVYWSYLGRPLDDINFFHYGNMFYPYVVRKAAVPRHTSHEIAEAFMQRFYELNGECWFGCRAEEFLFDGDRVCGVRTNLGTVRCKQVLANINPDIIYGKMMPKNLVPERAKKLCAARNRNYSARMYVCYFGLNKTAEELGIRDYTVFFENTADSRNTFERMEHIDSNDCFILVCYNNLIPDFSPVGTCVCSFTTMYGPEDWNRVTPEEYPKVKEKIAEKFIAAMKEKLGVDIGPYIEEVEIASPMTFARQIGSPEGAVYGYAVSGWDAMIARMMMVSEEFTVKGLRYIGAASLRGDGYSSAWHNGEMCAMLACKEIDAERG